MRAIQMWLIMANNELLMTLALFVASAFAYVLGFISATHFHKIEKRLDKKTGNPELWSL